MELQSSTKTISPKKIKLDFKESKYATGRRKESIAKVWICSGTGLITVNKKKFEDYFKDNALRMIINQPLEVAKKTDSIDKT